MEKLKEKSMINVKGRTCLKLLSIHPNEKKYYKKRIKQTTNRFRTTISVLQSGHILDVFKIKTSG